MHIDGVRSEVLKPVVLPNEPGSATKVAQHLRSEVVFINKTEKSYLGFKSRLYVFFISY